MLKLSYDFVKEYAKKYNAEILTKEENYEGVKQKILFKCHCGETFTTTFDAFKNAGKHTCNKCALAKNGNKNRKTHEHFLSQLPQYIINEYTLLSRYTTAKEKIKMRHNKCGHVYYVTPSDILAGHKCPVCQHKKSGKPTKTLETFKKEVYNVFGNEYSILSDKYVSTHSKIKIRHNKCGRVYYAEPNSILHGNGCRKCADIELAKRQTRTQKEFINLIYKLVGNDYEVMSEYKKSVEKVKMKHNSCGHVWSVNANSFVNGCRCPKCYGNIKKTTSEFKEQVFSLVNEEYSVLGQYVNAKVKILIKHNKCGHEYMVDPSGFLAGHRCPRCSESHGEIAIRNFLIEKHMKHKAQYRIAKCKIEKPLPFDFAVFDKNKLLALIEYQGIQHFKPIGYFGGEEQFSKQQKRDKVKKNYCKAKNIPLIEIPYTEKDIETYLDNELSKLNKPIQLALI